MIYNIHLANLDRGADDEFIFPVLFKKFTPLNCLCKEKSPLIYYNYQLPMHDYNVALHYFSRKIGICD